ncbi:MAG: ABC transporter permease subunit [Mesorhizobium sp.]|uniref:amino acid ABC transporter permease n=1 Tax=unclassified Mesorhizobium TaxID=325217 RepID=UPI000FCB53CE|nr:MULTISPECIES: amino acid ABC transporter permease [unclassified Mesorhizobium]MCT2581089.1 amino acid ABC transporter permease [Mesorhizobium sp. P13.3]MDF3170151.1 amino acid ABC transporter permease [Mesorhizobium sp. P16.1]MDF3187002.1 amino acid ABC transporter permease [Mesorhizobium sp. ICCV3110.1]RUV55518.1 amino acid ABC transporter permease [Mesorhizobium sp. M1A.F.Ca.IN.022.02.1.1]RUV68552.1 amino acid ABC transporter permease [Mesorhizobium sp. M1A.F.Ca.IN.020.30.1.1]
MSFDLSFAVSSVPLVLEGVGNTLLVASLSFIGATILGFFWEMLRRSHRLVRPVAQFIVDAIRSTPSLVQIYFLFFVLPYYGIVLPALFVGIFGLSLYFSGYISEVFKAGIEAVPVGQTEAARSLGLNRSDTVVFVIAPQMLRNIAAPLGAYSVSILKSTPILAVIAVPEMLGSAFDVASETYRYAEPMLVAGILFLILALIAVALVTRLERWLGVSGPSH